MKEHSHSTLQLEQNLLHKAREVKHLLGETSELPETRPVMQRRLETYRDSLDSLVKLQIRSIYKTL